MSKEDSQVTDNKTTKVIVVTAVILAVCIGATFLIRSLLEHEPQTITVTGQIQEALESAKSGDTVIIPAGTYNETLAMDVPEVSLVGAVDSEGNPLTILDGQESLAFGLVGTADDISIENLDIRNYNNSGIMVTGSGGFEDYDGEDSIQRGYEIINVVATDNTQYGIYAFQAEGGLIDNVTASGNADSGIYIGQCNPCNVTTTNSTAVNNAIGFYATNASNGVIVEDSVFTNNRVGVVINSQEIERLAPQVSAIVRNNLVTDNSDLGLFPEWDGPTDVGIYIGGGQDNLIEANTVENHKSAGIFVADNQGFDAKGNEVIGNQLTNNSPDIEVSNDAIDADSPNCFSENSGDDLPEGCLTSAP